MDEAWATIPTFDRYSASSLGQIRNDRTERIMSLTMNQRGMVYVTLRHDGSDYVRSVARLVASIFVPGEDERSNTVIHRNGFKADCSADNLAWRPLWFAREYHRQFNVQAWKDRYSRPIMDRLTGQTWPSLMDTAISNGLLCVDIINGMSHDHPLFPTGQTFEWA